MRLSAPLRGVDVAHGKATMTWTDSSRKVHTKAAAILDQVLVRTHVGERSHGRGPCQSIRQGPGPSRLEGGEGIIEVIRPNPKIMARWHYDLGELVPARGEPSVAR